MPSIAASPDSGPPGPLSTSCSEMPCRRDTLLKMRGRNFSPRFKATSRSFDPRRPKLLSGALRMTMTLKSYSYRDLVSSESLVTLLVCATITMVSVVAMLLYTSPEFTWDEADYLPQTANHWG